MKVITTTLGCDAGLSGIGRYTSTLLEQWVSAGVDLEIYGHACERKAFLPKGEHANWHPVAECWRKPIGSILWHQLLLPFKTSEADVLFLPAGNRRLPAYRSVPTVATVQDCSSLHVEGKYDRARDLYIKKVLPWLMRQVDHVITVSDSTRRDLVDFCGVAPEAVTVIPLAADGEVFYVRDREESQSHIGQRYGITAPFLLYTSRIEHPGKNHVQLIRAFEILKRRHRIPHRLVFVGPDKERAEEVHRAAALSPAAAEIVFTGAVPGEDLPHFYSAADALVFPSLYEGFGLPLLEALACGTPVACSDRSSMPEVAGASGVLFDPADPISIAAAVAGLLSESASAAEARRIQGLRHAKKFSWQNTAERTLQVLADASLGSHTVQLADSGPVPAAK